MKNTQTLCLRRMMAINPKVGQLCHVCDRLAIQLGILVGRKLRLRESITDEVVNRSVRLLLSHDVLVDIRQQFVKTAARTLIIGCLESPSVHALMPHQLPQGSGIVWARAKRDEGLLGGVVLVACAASVLQVRVSLAGVGLSPDPDHSFVRHLLLLNV